VILSYSHRFLYLHIPKTAGSSLHAALSPFAYTPEDHWLNRLLNGVGIHVNYFGPCQLKRFRTHATASVVRQHLPRDIFEGLFRFAFVRNPWDLLVSYYHYILSNPRHHRHWRVKTLGTFAAYVDYEIQRNKFAQHHFVCDDRGEVIVNYLGRFENLDDDYAAICRRLKIVAPLGRFNVGSHADYRTYYTDVLAERVGRHFQTDVERFGYSFDTRHSRQVA